ncbi:MAG: hypothetical protein EPO55_21020 [Reyranella sp.]|uniref:hypothetical protein n=1 Tax=Reyranella sp. TaxID=1929291 RepID=UPI00121B7CD8|nr:hypothetical protein [Reyranella sp.]TAJ36723.1 MAG: hypothetical protein EPO55_21020 [Reyranella sp.]
MTTPRLIHALPGERLSPERRRLAFLRAFFATGSASYAAACAGVDRTTPYLWRAQDPEFAAAWEVGRSARRTHASDRLTQPIGRMNDKMLMYAIRRTAGKRARISTPDTTTRHEEMPPGQGSDRL